jgi:hypothetical protein
MNTEGFAYFRWHSIKWPWTTECTQCDSYLCVRMWRELQGRS